MSEIKRNIKAEERKKIDETIRFKWELKNNEDFLYLYDVSTEKFLPLVKIVSDADRKIAYINTATFTSVSLPLIIREEHDSKWNYVFFEEYISLDMVKVRHRIEKQLMFSFSYIADAMVEESVNDFIEEILKNSKEDDSNNKSRN